MAESRKNIFWLASYPKSGNTWFRVFLSNLLSGKDEAVSINKLHPTPIASSRERFDELTGVKASAFTHDEVDCLRPDVYRLEAEESDELLFKKVHDAYQVLPNGQALFPADVSRGVIYFVRHPLDVAVSFAHHNVQEHAHMVQKLQDSNYGSCRSHKRIANQLRQHLDSWQQHVEGWLNQQAIPLHLVRYEDMISETFRTFAKALDFIGLDYTKEQVEQAIAFSSMEQLQNQEETEGFKEKTPRSEKFFRKGQPGSWQEELDPKLAKNLINATKPLMNRLGYDNPNDLIHVK
jgi:hypothetical protein